MKVRIRHINGVDLVRTFSAVIRGGGENHGGYDDVPALVTVSNEYFPCLKSIDAFTVLVEIEELKNEGDI